MDKIVIETPFLGLYPRTFQHFKYCRACLRDSLSRGEAPLPSFIFLMFDGLVDVKDVKSRKGAALAANTWTDIAQKLVIYIDLGITDAMKDRIRSAKDLDQVVEYRKLGDKWESSNHNVLISSQVSDVLCRRLKDLKHSYTNRVGFSSGFATGYQQGLSEARHVIAEAVHKTLW